MSRQSLPPRGDGRESAWPCAAASARHAGPPPAILGSSACKGPASRAPGASPEASARSPPG